MLLNLSSPSWAIEKDQQMGASSGCQPSTMDNSLAPQAYLIDHTMGIYPPPDYCYRPTSFTYFLSIDPVMNWVYIGSMRAGQTVQFIWYAPDGTYYPSGIGTVDYDSNWCWWHWWSYGPPNIEGWWSVSLFVDGAYWSSDSFYVYACTYLGVDVEPVGGGKVTGPGIDCGSDCWETFWNDESITLKATRNPGYKFLHWDNGTLCYPNGSISVKMKNHRFYQAVFQRIKTIEASDFVYPVLGVSQSDPLQNRMDPLKDGWGGKGVGKLSAAQGHLGQDYYLTSGDSSGQPVFAIANGEIVEVLNGPGKYGWCDNQDHGWGPVVVIKHVRSSGFKVSASAVKDPDGCGTDMHPSVVYSLYGHLSKESIKTLSVGQRVDMGQRIGTIGKYRVDQVSWETNHLHFEIKDEIGFMEGTWYKSHPKTCPGSITYKCGQREINGIGTAYSKKADFAPHRYVPSVFINRNSDQ
jgi:murein DD-endopeptidase MepM/ murein hydrolase activator NlpD